MRIISQRQKVDERGRSPHNSDGRSGHPGDMPKLEAELSPAELHSPNLSDCIHPDDDDDDCLNFLAALDISNEANVM